MAGFQARAPRIRRRDFLKAALVLPAAMSSRVARGATQPKGRFEFAPRRIEVRDARRTGAEEMAAIGGWWSGPALRAGFRGLSTFHEGFRQRCLEAKKLNPALKILAVVRFELFARFRDIETDPKGGWPAFQGGFLDEWIHWIDRDAWADDMKPWLDAGFEILPGWQIDPEWYERTWNRSAERRPVTYMQIQHARAAGDRTSLRVNQVVVDLTNLAYQDWLVEEIRWGVSHTGVDGLQVGTKAGFWWFNPELRGQELRVLPGGVWSFLRKEWDRPGPFDTAACLTRSPYGPGEYERGMSAIFVKLAKHGIRCVTSSRPPAHSGQWTPYTPEAREVLLGELSTPLTDRIRRRAGAAGP